MRKIPNILYVFLFVSVFAIGSFIVESQSAFAGKGVQGCEVEVVLNAIPEGDTEFTFISTPGDEFTLVETGEWFKILFVPIGGSLQVTEIVPEGWTLVDVSCESRGSEGFILIENGFFLESCVGDLLVCNFVNALEVRPIPALSQWGIIAAAVVLGIVGIVFYSRRKAAA